MTDALVVVPPLLKMAGAPLLGPAMLVSAGRSAGHLVEVRDLNAEWLGPYLERREWAGEFVGDHDRPSSQLAAAHAAFDRLMGGSSVRALSHLDVLHRAELLAASEFGDFVRAHLVAPLPPLVGMSVMYEGQVLAALAVTRVIRVLQPSSMVVWGGAHVTALQNEIARDARYGAWVDRFVFGYAERTWVELLDAVSSGGEMPASAIVAGSGTVMRAAGDPSVTPHFDGLEVFGARLTLPAQTSRGCAYGRCTFCTYPSIEGRYRPHELKPSMEVVARAAELGAAVSFKDSLVTPDRLLELARAIDGRVRWSACTKLNRRFTPSFMRELAAGGCHTLEFGVETLDPTAQQLIRKSQSGELLVGVLDAAMTSGVALVLNYITGFPGIDAAAEERWLDFVRQSLRDRPSLTAKLSVSRFELERLAPMAMDPSAHRIRVLNAWPWSSLLEWENSF